MFIEKSYSQKSKTNGVKIITYPTFCPWGLASLDFVFSYLRLVSFEFTIQLHIKETNLHKSVC